MAGIQCKVDIPTVRGLEDSQITVGREFYLNCSGDWPRTLKPEAVQFENAEAIKYQLKLLKFEFRSPTEADLKITSYHAGDHRWQDLAVTDGSQKVQLGPVQFQVQSVLPQGEEKVEAFGPIGPASIPVPLFYWLVMVGVLLLTVALVGLRFWRYNQRKAMLQRLKEHDLALSPLQEFHQSMRRLQRANSVFYDKEATPEELRSGVDELTRMFKVYLSRRLRVPAFEWGDRLVLKDIKRYHSDVYSEFGRKIQDLFNEFKKAQSPQQKLQSHDVTQLADGLRKLLEGMDRFLGDKATLARGGRR